jgi:hypothetical protein
MALGGLYLANGWNFLLALDDGVKLSIGVFSPFYYEEGI